MEGKIKTGARAPRSELLKVRETNTPMPVIEQSVAPFVAELSTLTSIWQFALPFGLTSSTVPSIDTIRQYRIDFKTVRDNEGNVPVFVLAILNTDIFPPQASMRPYLLSDERGRTEPKAKRFRETGVHIISTW